MRIGTLPILPTLGIVTSIFLIFHLDEGAVLLGSAIALVGGVFALVLRQKAGKV